ncbi:hypothetical protein AB0N73_06635 [Microbacterium sp. NPDC089189]|uniref:hypothetical protein n=1 Tax=Microbacterium sp. NPDC089189 TaxID=3154972 RepID=UPI00344295A1
MEWTADVSVGEWLRERIDPWRGTMHDVVPRGFAAYARVLHPTTRSRPVGRDWPPIPQDRHRREWERFADDGVQIETEPALWRDAAASFGTTLHPLAQWGALVKSRGDEWSPSDWQQAQSADGWQYDAPREGELDAAVTAALAQHLVARAGAQAGYAAVWSGWGGLLGHMGVTPSRGFLTLTAGEDDDADLARHREMLALSRSDPFNRPYATETWQRGILADDVSRGPLLELPGREHVLFAGALEVFADPLWQRRVPWHDVELENAGFASTAASPSLLWPDDRSWVLTTDVDWDSTIVGGDADLIAAICADPALEALPIAADSSLQWDADEVNR